MCGHRELCITDEHYDPTVLAYQGVGEQTTCNPNSLVEVNWRQYEWEAVRTPPAPLSLSHACVHRSTALHPTTTCSLRTWARLPTRPFSVPAVQPIFGLL